MEKKYYVTADDPIGSFGCGLVFVIGVILSVVSGKNIDNTVFRWTIIVLIWLIVLFIGFIPYLKYGKPSLTCTDDKLKYDFGNESWEMEISKIDKAVYTVTEERSRYSTSYTLRLKIEYGEGSEDWRQETFQENVSFEQMQDIAAGKKEGFDLIEIHDWIAERRPDIAEGFVKKRDFW